MAQTGTIYGCHDGNTYSLANIYDEKLNEIVGGNVFESPSRLSVQFDTTTGLIFASNVIDPNYVFYSISTTDVKGRGNSPETFIPYISDSALQLVKTQKSSFKIANQDSRIPILFAYTDGGKYIKHAVPTFTIEGYFYVDVNNAYPKYAGIFTLAIAAAQNSVSFDQTPKFGAQVSYRDANTAVYPIPAPFGISDCVRLTDIDKTFFDDPFHLRVVFNPSNDRVAEVYLNGALHSYRSRSSVSQYYQYYINTIVIGADTDNSGTVTSGATFYNIAFNNFQFYTSRAANLTPVNANMLIRHNAANHYIPLTTNAANTTAPYLAVRHGNTNFYTLK